MQLARKFKTAAECGDCVEMGRLKTIGHNGVRVTWAAGHKLVDDYADLDYLASNEHPLAYVPGSYECSAPALDELVDAAGRLEAVYGAGLPGAGLGGSIVVLCRRGSVALVVDHLRQSYYAPRGLP